MTKVFQRSSVIPTTMAQLVHFHGMPNALRILTPPPLIVTTLSDRRIALTQGTVDFILWFGPVPVRWLARHEPGPTPMSFIDRMLNGPLASWEHQHIFREVPGGVELTDRITFAHKEGWRGMLTQLFFDGLPLDILFAYRHWRTKLECRRLSA